MAADQVCPAWRRALVDARVAQPLADLILAQGYIDQATFHFSFTTPQALEDWLQTAFTVDGVAAQLGVDPNRWAICPQAGAVRHLWHEASRLPAAGALALPSAPASSGDWQEPPPPKLRPEKMQEMKEVFRRCYPSELLDEDNTPGVRYWSAVYEMLQKNQLKWLPWTSILCVEQENRILENRPRRGGSLSDVAALLRLASDDPPELREHELRPTPHRIEQILRVRRVTFALCQGCHYGSHLLLDKKMLKLYNKPQPEGLRGPTLKELIDADKEIYGLVYELTTAGWQLDNALHEFAMIRTDIVGLLMPRPKTALPVVYNDRRQRPRGGKGREKGAGQEHTPPNRPSRPSKPEPKGGKAKGKGRDKGKGKRQGASLDGWDPSWLREGVVNGRTVNFCMRYNVGECRMRGCRFSHRCAVPKPDGTPCNGNHAAVDHTSGAAPRT